MKTLAALLAGFALSALANSASAIEASESPKNRLSKCIDTVTKGSKDGACTGHPNTPDCVGLNQATTNATNCLAYDGKNHCAAYGERGFTMGEWLAFGSQYTDAMKQCYEPMKASDQNLTPSQAANFLADKFNDGSVFLGYENGEIMKRAFSDVPFSEIVKGSPFVTKLEPIFQTEVNHALEDPKTTIARAGKSLTDQAKIAEIAVAAPAAITETKSEAVNNSASAEVRSPSVFPSPTLPPTTQLEQAEAVFARERAAANATPQDVKRQLASIEKISPSALHPLNELTDHSSVQDATTQTDEATLFVRVHDTYRRRHKDFEPVKPAVI
ncbi:MAG: hypothetical protein ACXWQO_03740 [Bdellovibrionota bacterium]